MLDSCFQRNFDERPSSFELLSHPYIRSAPGDDLLRQASEESMDGISRDSEIFGDSGNWGGEKNRGRRQKTGVESDDDDDGYGGVRNVETNYDDEFDEGDSWGSGGGGGGGGGGENFLGTGLLESKSSLVSMGGGSGGEITSSLSRVASIKKFSAMNNDVETYIQTRAEDYEQMMSNTFNQTTSMGTPPVSRPPKDNDDDGDSDSGGDGGDNPFGSSSSNPFASSSDMFDKTFSN